MPERTYSRESEIDATRASARLPGLDIDIIHRQSPNGDWEQMSINLRATPSFEALGSLFEAANPFTFWVQAARFMWTPWLLMAQTMMLAGREHSRAPSSLSKSRRRLAVSEPKDQGNDTANQQRCCERDINPEVVALDDNVAGQPAEANLVDHRP